MQMHDNRVPVTLLTGFLGAGKTTLLNQLLRAEDARNCAVIINEFGDVGLDHDLIEEVTEETVLMQSGCVCCSIRGDLAETLHALSQRRKRGLLSFDRVVIETTGIADPGPIFHTLVVDDRVAPVFRMDGVVTLVDAATGPMAIRTHADVESQIAMADLVVVTKTDLATAVQLQALDDAIRAVNETAPRIAADHGKVPAGCLFGLSALRDDATVQDMDFWLGNDSLSAIAPSILPPALLVANTAPVSTHSHGRVATASIEMPEPIPAEEFDFWIEQLILLNGPEILRLKGILHVEGADRPFVIHGVQHIFNPPVPLQGWSGRDTCSRIVVIARNMEQDQLQARLDALIDRPQRMPGRSDGMLVHTLKLAV